MEERPPPAPPSQGAQDSFTVGGSVSGLVGSGLVLQNNGAGDLAVAADGSFQFATRFATGTAYSVAVVSHPTSPSQTCNVTKGSGSIANANVADVAVTCATGQFSIRGTVSGLTGAGLVLQNNGGNDFAVSTDGRVRIRQPADRWRHLLGSRAHAAERTELHRAQFRRHDPRRRREQRGSRVLEWLHDRRGRTGLTGSGLAGSGLVLQLNRGNDLSIVRSGGFRIRDGSAERRPL